GFHAVPHRTADLSVKTGRDVRRRPTPASPPVVVRAREASKGSPSFEKWTLPPLGRRRHGDLRLLLFPFAGGGASVFNACQAQFPAKIETYAVQYPGRESRWSERRFVSLRELVAAIADELMPHVAGPFAFLGHSLGGLIAFELARLLERQGRPAP